MWTTVGKLLRCGCPPTILRKITKIVIDAIDAQTRRWVAHVGVEIFKSQPARANRDAAAAVIGIDSASRVKTARLHATPALVGAIARQAVLREELSSPFCRHFFIKAAAALRASAPQTPSLYDALDAA